MTEEGPTIIRDEDWKERVRREKEEAARKTEATKEEKVGEETKEEEQRSLFSELVSHLGMEALHALGFLVPPDAKEIRVSLPIAQWTVEVLMDLREKTKGQLTPKEQGRLAEVISELQRGYVAMAQAVHEAEARAGAAAETKAK